LSYGIAFVSKANRTTRLASLRSGWLQHGSGFSEPQPHWSQTSFVILSKAKDLLHPCAEKKAGAWLRSAWQVLWT